MLAVLSLLVIVSLSLLITRIGSVALTFTGVSSELAYFQAFSAFSGVGFTTLESEKVVNHPVRRRILVTLMLAGNVGVVTAVSSLILTFVQVGSRAEWISRIVLLTAGLLVLFLLGSSKWLNRLLYRLISWSLERWAHLEVYDYDSLLQLSGGYSVLEIKVHEQDWLAGRTLADLNLNQEGVLVLGIRRADQSYVGSPTGNSYVFPDDTLILYGRQSRLRELGGRQRGSVGEGAHQEAMAAQQLALVQQAQSDSAHEPRKNV